VKLMMAFAIAKEQGNNLPLFLAFLLGSLCIVGNLHVLVLGLVEFKNGVAPTFVKSHTKTLKFVYKSY
jgi:hypothetical protein